MSYARVIALVEEALAILDAAGGASSPAACDLQSALEHLGVAASALDLHRLTRSLFSELQPTTDLDWPLPSDQTRLAAST